MNTLLKNAAIGTMINGYKFIGIGDPGSVSGYFGRPVWFEYQYEVCGKTLDDKIITTGHAYAEILDQDDTAFYLGYFRH